MKPKDLEALGPVLIDPIRTILAKHYAKEKDILNWGRICFPEKFGLPFCGDLHGYLVATRGLPMTATEAPRNHAKTTIACFLIPIFQALEEPESFRHYLNVQSTGAKAISVNLSIKVEIEENPLLQKIYGNQVGTEKWTDQQFVLKNGVIFTAVGAGQSIRGLNYRNFRPDYIMIDDLYDEEDIHNLESTRKKTAWFWSSLYPARAKSRRCAIHIQGTAINDADILEELKSKLRWKARTFRAIMDWDKGTVLWPELNSFETLNAELGDMTATIFMREMQNERTDDKESYVKRAWLEPNADWDGWEFDPMDLKFDEHFFLLEVLLLCDPSIGTKHQNDFTGIALILKTGYDDGRGNDYWILQLWNEHLSLDERVILLQKIGDERPKEEPLGSVRIEAIAGFKDFAAEVKRRTNLPVVEIDVVKDKIANLENKSHYFQNRKVHLNKHISPKLKDMVKYQLTTNFPTHDDVRDAVLLALDEKSKLWTWVG